MDSTKEMIRVMDEWNGKVHLLSVQPEPIVDELLAGRTVRCDVDESMKSGFASGDKDFSTSVKSWYDWMSSELGKFSKRPDGVEWPMWAWARYGSWNKTGDIPVDDVVDTWTDDAGVKHSSRNVVIALEVDASRVLLSSFDDWCAHVLFSQMIPSDDLIRPLYTADDDALFDKWMELNDSASEDEIKGTWYRCLRSLDYLRLEPVEAIETSTVSRSVDDAMTVEGQLVPDSVVFNRRRMDSIEANGMPYHYGDRRTGREVLQCVLWEFRPEDVVHVWPTGSRRIGGSGRFLDWNHDTSVRYGSTWRQ